MLKDRTCTRCGNTYNPDGIAQKYCAACRPFVYEEQRQAREERRRERLEEQRFIMRLREKLDRADRMDYER